MKVYFEVKRYSRLGNWMFQYAAAKTLSADVACYIEHPELEAQLRKSEWFKDIEIISSVPEGTYIYKQPSFRYAPIEIPKGTERVLLCGYFQSERFFDADIARGLFGCPAALKARLTSEYGEFLNRPHVTSIHVRRGDYLWNLQSHPFVGRKFFADAIKALPEVKDFVVCSDDLPWCQKYFTPARFKGRNFHFSHAASALEDLYLTSLCQHNIISNSSFGWWGAWLNENPQKRVLAPSLWFGYYYSNRGWDWRDIYTDSMTVIQNPYDLLGLARGHLCYRWILFKKWALPAWRLVQKVRGAGRRAGV